MSKLYVLVGLPGSGKSSWIEKHLTDNDVHISRDEIRFELLEPNDEYFKHEDLVFNRFVEHINFGLRSGFNVFADATHISKGSRWKLLSRINVPNTEVAAIWIRTPFEQTLIQNAQREGRALVPEDVIYNMRKGFQAPTFEEGFSEIYIIEPNKPIEIIRKGDK